MGVHGAVLWAEGGGAGGAWLGAQREADGGR